MCICRIESPAQRSSAYGADSAGVARASANVSQLHFGMRIPFRNLLYYANRDLYVANMGALSADEVLLAGNMCTRVNERFAQLECTSASLSVVSLHTAKLVSHKPTHYTYVFQSGI